MSRRRRVIPDDLEEGECVPAALPSAAPTTTQKPVVGAPSASSLPKKRRVVADGSDSEDEYVAGGLAAAAPTTMQKPAGLAAATSSFAPKEAVPEHSEGVAEGAGAGVGTGAGVPKACPRVAAKAGAGLGGGKKTNNAATVGTTSAEATGDKGVVGGQDADSVVAGLRDRLEIDVSGELALDLLEKLRKQPSECRSPSSTGTMRILRCGKALGFSWRPGKMSTPSGRMHGRRVLIPSTLQR